MIHPSSPTRLLSLCALTWGFCLYIHKFFSSHVNTIEIQYHVVVQIRTKISHGVHVGLITMPCTGSAFLLSCRHVHVGRCASKHNHLYISRQVPKWIDRQRCPLESHEETFHHIESMNLVYVSQSVHVGLAL